MGLFTSPVTLDTDRIFEKRGQIFDKKGITVVEYIEPAAALSAESLLTVKHDDSGSVKRHLLQRTTKRVPSADSTAGLRRITVNLTVVADPLFTDTEVSEETDILLAGAAVANFVKNFMNSLT